MSQESYDAHSDEAKINLAIQNLDYSNTEVLNKIKQEHLEKEQKFIDRISAFKDVQTLEEATELAEKILPVAQEVNKFKIGDAKCIVIRKREMLRISFNSEKEFVSYDFK